MRVKLSVESTAHTTGEIVHKIHFCFRKLKIKQFNPLNAELNPICHLLALLGGATIVVVSRLRVKISGRVTKPSKVTVSRKIKL